MPFSESKHREAIALLIEGRASEALTTFELLANESNDKSQRLYVGIAELFSGRPAAAIQTLQDVCRNVPRSWLAHHYLAVILASTEDSSIRDPDAALRHAVLAARYTNWQYWEVLCSVGAASAACEKWKNAEDAYLLAEKICPTSNQRLIRERLARVQQRLPIRSGLTIEDVYLPALERAGGGEEENVPGPENRSDNQ